MFNLGHVSIDIILIRMESFGKENMFHWSIEKIKGPDPKLFDHQKKQTSNYTRGIPFLKTCFLAM